jgi:putative hydrolase of the HAD superfamily
MGIIFDFDGLIIDTESAIYEVWRELYGSHGHELTIETWSRCVGSDFSHSYDPKAELEQLTGLQFDWKAEEERLTARAHELLANYPVLPGVRELLASAKAAGIPCAVASSSPRDWVQPHVERVGLADYFTSITTREDVDGRIKPAPDLFLAAAERLQLPTDQLVVLEDSLNGLRAAMAAGIRCVVIPGPTTQHLSFEGAWKRLGSMAELSLDQLAATS